MGVWLGGFCRPTSAMFLLTERCNARCVHCDIWKNKGREESPGLTGWSKVLQDLHEWVGPISVVFTGGEALLTPFAVELASYACSLGFPLEVLTHGYWPDQKKIEALARANPWRITISMDGVGETHSVIRGRTDFFEKTDQTIQTLLRIRSAGALRYTIRLKTVVMDQNLDNVSSVAQYANRPGMEVFYQPIEQNYNTPEDPAWFERSPNWPRDIEKAVRIVGELRQLRSQGLNIANSESQLDAMARYFADPASLRVVTQAHAAHRRRPPCAALSTLQFQSNGDVTVCSNRPPVGNVKSSSIRAIWSQRPRYWGSECCLESGPGQLVNSKSGPPQLPADAVKV